MYYSIGVTIGGSNTIKILSPLTNKLSQYYYNSSFEETRANTGVKKKEYFI